MPFSLVDFATSRTAISALPKAGNLRRSWSSAAAIPTFPLKSFLTRDRANFSLSARGEYRATFAPDGRAHGVSAALEFGVGALKVRHIVVLGHAQCGGVKAFAEDAEPISPGDFIGNWMKLMSPAAERLGPRGTLSHDEYLTRLEQANVVNSIDNLMTFPRLRTLIERGQVLVHGAYFGVATGQLSVRDPAAEKFVQIAADDYSRMFAQPRF